MPGALYLALYPYTGEDRGPQGMISVPTSEHLSVQVDTGDAFKMGAMMTTAPAGTEVEAEAETETKSKADEFTIGDIEIGKFRACDGSVISDYVISESSGANGDEDRTVNASFSSGAATYAAWSLIRPSDDGDLSECKHKYKSQFEKGESKEKNNCRRLSLSVVDEMRSIEMSPFHLSSQQPTSIPILTSSALSNQSFDEHLENESISNGIMRNNIENSDSNNSDVSGNYYTEDPSFFPFSKLQLRYLAYTQVILGLILMPVCLFYAIVQ